MTDTQNTPAVITDADEIAIRAAATQIIAKAALKGGYTIDQIPQEAKDDALNFARNAYAEDQAQKANPLYAQLQAEREAHRLTKMQMDAIKQTRVSVGNDVRPGLNPEVVSAQMGELDWRALTDNGRLQSCGIDPSKVTDVERLEAKKLFGRGMDSHYSSNFFKQDAGRYRHLKNIAIILGIQGQ